MSVNLVKYIGRHRDDTATPDLYVCASQRTYVWFPVRSMGGILVPVAEYSTGARHAVSA
jgi:hypothetical protein